MDATLYGPRVRAPYTARGRYRHARPPLDWAARSHCRGRSVDPDLFYSSDEDDRALALLICASCPVLAECQVDVGTWPKILRDVGMTCGGAYYPPDATNRKRAARDRSK